MVYSDSIDGGQEGSGDQCGCVHWTKTASCVACSLIWGQRVANSVQCLTTRGVLPLHSCGKMQNVFKIHIRNVLGWKWVRQNGLNIPVPEASDFFLPKEKFPCSARFKQRRTHEDYRFTLGLVFLTKFRLFQTVPNYISFLGLPQQFTTNSVAENNRNLSSHSSRGQKSKMKMLAEPCSFWRLYRRIFLCPFQVLVASSVPYLGQHNSNPCLHFHGLSSMSHCVFFSVLPNKNTCHGI